MDNQVYATIEDTVFDTIGCTEPVAVAYAATAAYGQLGGTLYSIKCTVSVNVLKNAMSVGIPGSDKKGIPYAVALGISGGDWKKGLKLFEDIDEEKSEAATELASRGLIELDLYTGPEKIYIHTEITSDRGRAQALIRDSHDDLKWVKVNGERVYGVDEESSEAGRGTEAGGDSSDDSGALSSPIPYEKLVGLSMERLVEMVEGLDDEKLRYLEEGVEINRRAAEYGFENAPAMALGAGLASLEAEGVSDGSLASRVAGYVAAAADSRMGGGMIHIKGCGGSGNHGITFFLTLGLAYDAYRDKAHRSLGKSLAMGLLLVRYVKAYTGLLTPTCGVTVSAAPSAAAAIVYALGGSPEQMTAAVKLVYGNIAGILCDGAKHGCALKSSTSARAGIEAAFLALHDVEIPASDGIVDADLPGTLEHFRRLQNEGLVDADRTMLDILLKKAEKLDGSV